MEKTIEQQRNDIDACIWIDRAIEMLKELPEIKRSLYAAGYNGVVSLLQYAKDSHNNSKQ